MDRLAVDVEGGEAVERGGPVVAAGRQRRPAGRGERRVAAELQVVGGALLGERLQAGGQLERRTVCAQVRDPGELRFAPGDAVRRG